MIHRRSFLIGAAFAGLTLSRPPALFAKTTTDPIATTATLKAMYGHLDGLRRVIERSYVAVSPAPTTLRAGQVLGVIAVGLAFESEEAAANARNLHGVLGKAFASALEADGKFTLKADVEVSMPALGDASMARDQTAVSRGTGETYIVRLSSVTVRRGAHIQLIHVIGVNRPVIEDAVDIAEVLDGTWPSPAAERLGASGQHQGGLWEMLPTLNQVPTGLRACDDLELVLGDED